MIPKWHLVISKVHRHEMGKEVKTIIPGRGNSIYESWERNRRWVSMVRPEQSIGGDKEARRSTK